ncbi:hypothetical protein H6F93_12015 [Leptolyngbya sp. FACHB-671]|uniref:hypothetical protein n=1 Tax=Leptolyngbya sp. FACHB-671 TaxID=2692812 RepID=UPI00168332F5|nr:hypothetical protein [Leptolyngbya sp. FACHB-671]MBD2068237.1 hypothetical protein [Leptolyngbya sp. FACHB-671]
MEFFFSQLIGLLVGILSSWAFLYVLLLAKPRIIISKNIVFNKKKGSLLIKVMNRSRRQATDIQASLALVERDTIGRFFTLHSAQLRKDSLPALAPKHESHNPWGLRTAYVFATDEGVQILEKLSSAHQNEKRLVFTLSATDGLSGTKVVQQISYRLEDVKSGRFGIGLEVKEDGVQQLQQSKQDSDDDGDFIA